MKKKFILILLMAIVAMTARAYTYYNNVEIGYLKYYIGLKTSPEEEEFAWVQGLSSTGIERSLSGIDIPGYLIYGSHRLRVTRVGGFENNTNLTDVRIRYGVEEIHYNAFKGCTALKTVQLPSSIKEIGNWAFENCTALEVLAYAGEVPPTFQYYTFNNSSTTKIVSTATYRGMNAMKANADWLAAFGESNIKNQYINTYDIASENLYYVIKDGLPYKLPTNPHASKCVIVGGSFTFNSKVTLTKAAYDMDNSPGGPYVVDGVADSAFMNRTAITQVVNDGTVADRIGHSAFLGCTNLTSVDVPVDTIANYAFYGCSNLTSATFTSDLNNLVYLGSYAFGACGFTSVTIPATTKFIGYAPFYLCTSLSSISVDASNTNYSSYGSALYNKSKTILYQVPGQCQFGVFAQTLERLCPYSVAGSKVETVLLPYNVKQIDQYAFRNCNNLQIIRFPSSVTNVNANAFKGCTAIKKVYLNLKTPPTIDYFPSVTSKSNVDLYTPYGSYTAYANSSIWSQYNRHNGTYDHHNCWDISSDNVYYTVTSTSAYSQNGYSGNGTLKVVGFFTSSEETQSRTVPPTISYEGKTYVPTEIGEYAVRSTDKALTITQAPSITKINNYAFYQSELTNFPFINVETIGSYSFYKCNSLKVEIGTSSLTFPHLWSIQQRAFSGSAIKAFKGTSAIRTIGAGAFANTNYLTSVDLSACTMLTVINAQAFAQETTDAHSTVKLPNTITTIGERAFYKNILTTFNFPRDLEEIKKEAFYYSSLPGVVELPYGVTTLEENALSSWKATKIVLPQSVTSVHSRFFTSTNQSTALKEICINTTSPLTFTNDSEGGSGYMQMEYTNANIFVPVGAVNAWRANPRWSTKFSINEGSYDFRNGAYRYTLLSFVNGGTSTCKMVYCPDTYNTVASANVGSSIIYDMWGRGFYVIQIDDKCFYNSTTFKRLYVGPHLQVIGNYAFYNSSLSYILDNATTSGGTPSVSDGYVIPSVHTIGNYAFYGCSNLHELFLPHIDGVNPINCGNYFFGNNASDFKCYVDYRRLADFVNTTKWDKTKIYPHLKLDSEWQSFACINGIDFRNSGVESYNVTSYNSSQKKATLTIANLLAANNGGVVHGDMGTYYRLKYASSGESSSWLKGVTGSSQTVNSNSTTSYFKLNATKPQFDKVTSSTQFNRGYAYFQISTSQTGGATSIITNLTSSVPGDVNGDNVCNAADVTALYNWILNNDASAIVNGDQNNDNVVNAGDVTTVYNIILSN